MVDYKERLELLRRYLHFCIDWSPHTRKHAHFSLGKKYFPRKVRSFEDYIKAVSDEKEENNEYIVGRVGKKQKDLVEIFNSAKES